MNKYGVKLYEKMKK